MVSTLGEILPYAARCYGDSTALVVGGDQLTYRQLDQASNAFANGLVGAGVKPGDRVTLYGPNSIEWMVAYFAIAKTGAVVNPINVMLTPGEVGFVVEDFGTRVIVGAADKVAPLMGLKGKGELADIVAWGEPTPTGATSFDLWLKLGAPTFDVVKRAPTDVGAICYTSGTTGHPKGAVQQHRVDRRRGLRRRHDGNAHGRRYHRVAAAVPARLRELRV